MYVAFTQDEDETKMEKQNTKFQTKAIYSISDADRAKRTLEGSRSAHQSWADRRRALSRSMMDKVRTKQRGRAHSTQKSPLWRRETFTLSRLEAREKAQEFFAKYPKAAYWSEIENWRVLEGDMIEFTMRRLPSAD